VGIVIGMIGAGKFSHSFIPLFQAHPDVQEVRLTDLHPERLAATAEEFGIKTTYKSADELCGSDVDAVAVFTPRWTHGPLVLQALNAGKHVYSTVPMASSVDEVQAIVEGVRSTGKIYMMGETSYYNPAAVYCRAKAQAGAFGRIFYAEGDYVHDMDLGFYDAYKRSGGERWKETASFPPMMYPTHALGGVLAVTGAHATAVSCVGSVDTRGDGVFDRSVSRWDNDFSNESALFVTSDGGAIRTNEMRRVGYPAHIRESRFRFFGTEASFEQLATVSVWQGKHAVEDVSYLMRVVKTSERQEADLAVLEPELRDGLALVHDRARLPKPLIGIRNGHEGAHPFLADDFVKAVSTNTQPPVSAWQAARYTVPGLVAHESAKQGGRQLPIPDFGDS
jgi:predicted dehydrogenase